jgi:magnesium-transporting ATPase (P-type)
MVIEGGALGVALEEALQTSFMALCKECDAVVCCRVSPMQKALVRGMDGQEHQPQDQGGGT